MIPFRNIPTHTTLHVRTFFTNVWLFARGFEPKIIGSADKNNVAEFLKSHYYPYEPLNTSLQSINNPAAISEQSDFYLNRAIADQCSVMLLNQEDKISSVLLNKIEKHGFAARPCKDPLVCKISKFYNYVHLECMVTKKYDTKTFLNIEVLAVDLQYVGKGLSQKMVAVTKEIAKEKKLPLLTFICTSNYTGMSAMKAGFITAFRMKYEDYQDAGKKVFTPKLPHTEVQVFALSIPI